MSDNVLDTLGKFLAGSLEGEKRVRVIMALDDPNSPEAKCLSVLNKLGGDLANPCFADNPVPRNPSPSAQQPTTETKKTNNDLVRTLSSLFVLGSALLPLLAPLVVGVWDKIKSGQPISRSEQEQAAQQVRKQAEAAQDTATVKQFQRLEASIRSYANVVD